MAAAEAIAEGHEVVIEPVVNAEEESDISVSEVEESDQLQSEAEAVVADINIADDEVVLKLDGVSDDLSIDDDSDSDITELDADNNFTLDEIQVDTDGVAGDDFETLVSDDIDVEGVSEIDSDAEDGVALVGAEIEEDDFDIEIDSIEDLDVSFNETIKTDDEAGSEDTTEDKVVENEEESDETIIALSADDDVEIIITEEGGNFELADDELDIDPMLLAIYHDESVGHLNDIKSKLD